MRKLRDVLRLTAAGMSSRQVAASLTVGATTVIDYLGRARRAGIAWPLPDELTDEALEASLYPPPPIIAKDRRPLPDWPAVHRRCHQCLTARSSMGCGRPASDNLTGAAGRGGTQASRT